jgi:hypothetical protein
MLMNARSIRIRVISCTSADELPGTRVGFKRADVAEPVATALHDAIDKNGSVASKVLT